MSNTNRSALFSSATDNWPTPQDFYDRLNAEFNFGLDVCSSKANHKAPNFYALDHDDPTCRDGLAGNWAADSAGLPVFCNPPYGRGIRAWMETALAAAHLDGKTVVCLVPVRADSAWWQDLVLESGAEVRYVRGRLKFGDAKHSAAFSSAVVIYRPTDVMGEAGPVRTMLNKLDESVVVAPEPPAEVATVPAVVPECAVEPATGDEQGESWEVWHAQYLVEQEQLGAEYDRAVEMAAGLPERPRPVSEGGPQAFVVRESDGWDTDLFDSMRDRSYDGSFRESGNVAGGRCRRASVSGRG